MSEFFVLFYEFGNQWKLVPKQSNTDTLVKWDGDSSTCKKVAPEQQNNKSCYNFTNIVRKCAQTSIRCKNVDYVYFNMRQLVQPAFFLGSQDSFNSTTVGNSCWCCCCFLFVWSVLGPVLALVLFFDVFSCVVMMCFCFIILQCIKISHDELYFLAEMRRSLYCWNSNTNVYALYVFENQIYTTSHRISVFLPVCAFFRSQTHFCCVHESPSYTQTNKFSLWLYCLLRKSNKTDSYVYRPNCAYTCVNMCDGVCNPLNLLLLSTKHIWR